MDDNFVDYLSEYEIRVGLNKIASEINRQYGTNDELIIVCILRGGFVFCADLVRRLNCQCKIEFIKVSSYIHNQQSQITLQSGLVELAQVQNKHVLIIDDINDSGNTLAFVQQYCREFGAKQIQSAVILQSNKSKSKADFYIHFKTDNTWVFGYGMDNNDLYRNLPKIYQQIEKADV